MSPTPVLDPPTLPPPTRRRRRRLAAVLAAAAVLTTVAFVVPGTDLAGTAASPASRLLGGTPDASDGRLPDGGVDPDADDTPGLARLDPDLLRAVRTAARAAQQQDDVTLSVTSGWRSRGYQQWLFEQAVERYGSPEEARRFVARPEDSSHLTGRAVDVGPTDAADWLGRHGAAYGLCQVFANEIWHFELLVEPGRDCPAMRVDSAEGR